MSSLAFKFKTENSGLDFSFRFQVSDFRFGFGAWGTGLLELGEPSGGSWGNPAGQPEAPGLQEVV